MGKGVPRSGGGFDSGTTRAAGGSSRCCSHPMDTSGGTWLARVCDRPGFLSFVHVDPVLFSSFPSPFTSAVG